MIIATFKLGKEKKKDGKKTIVPLSQPTVLVSVQSGKNRGFLLLRYCALYFPSTAAFGTYRLYSIYKAAKGM